jgi:hypothetical protein
MRSPCAGAALDPPLWMIPIKLSLSLSLGLQVSLLRDFGLWNRGLHDDVSIRKALRRLSARCATVVAEFIADSEARVPLATPTMQEVQDSES